MFFWCSFNESDSTLVILGVPLPQHRPGWFRSPDLMVHNARKLRPNWPNLFCWSRGNWSAPNSPNWRLSTGGFSRKLSLVSPHPPPSLASSLVIQVERPTAWIGISHMFLTDVLLKLSSLHVLSLFTFAMVKTWHMGMVIPQSLIPHAGW